MKNLTVNKPEGSKEYDWVDLTADDVKLGTPPPPPLLTYATGTNVTLISKAEYCKSIIADGKELITSNESGELIVPELKDEKVYITFKEDLQSLQEAFDGCSALTEIPENLFANCPNVTNFYGTFRWCEALTFIPENLFANNPKVTSFVSTFDSCSALTEIPENLFANNPKVTSFVSTFDSCSTLTEIPENLFANNPEVTSFHGTFWLCSTLTEIPENLFANNLKVTDFYGTFRWCSALTGESPYTMIGDKKVHLYERTNYPEHFTAPTVFSECFKDCTGLTDYAQIPSNWK